MPEQREPEDSGPLAPVRYLHHTTTEEAAEHEATGDVVEGELVTDAQYRELTSQKAQALERWRGYRRDVEVAYRTTKTVATHQRTKTMLRHTVGYPVAGMGVVLKQWRDNHGANRYERQMRAAEAAGDEEKLRYWQEAGVGEKQRRHQRVMDWIAAPGQWIRAGVVGLAGLTGFLLMLGIVLAINSGDISDVIGPVSAVVNAVAFTVWFLTAYGVFLLLGGTTAGLYYLYRQGRHHAEMPQWLAPSDDETDVMDGLPDESTILNALHNLGIQGFNKAIKGGWRIRFVTPPTIDGKGWRAQLALPPACPVEEIVKKKATLAHNLVRYPIEVWPTEPQPSVLDLWVAKPGALSGPVDPWPLLDDLDHASVDYFTGVPVGVTIKGDQVRGRLFEANYAFGGMMGSGKSTLAITLVLGAMLDPLVDIDVVVMAENSDFDPMQPRLHSLTTGAGDDTVDTCMNLLHWLYEELSLRGAALKEHDARAVTRELAEKDTRLRPRLVVIDECQNLFMGKHGKEAIELASKLMSTARKYAITLVFLTPEPSKDALPRKITSIASNKACFAIGDQTGNDAVLGTGSYKAGISAVGLTPKTDEGPGDIGTCMQRGFTAKPGLLRSYFVPQQDAHRVTKRALALLAEQGRTVTKLMPPADEDRDLLNDLDQVLDTEPISAADVPALLRELAPNHAPYRDLTGKALRAQLAQHSIKVPTTGNKPRLDPATVRNAIAERSTAETDDETDE